MLHFFDVFAPSLVLRRCPECPSFGLHKFLFLCSQVSLIVTESQCLSLSCSSSVNARVSFKDHRGFNCVVVFCCQASTCWVVQCLLWLCCFLFFTLPPWQSVAFGVRHGAVVVVGRRVFFMSRCLFVSGIFLESLC